MLESTARSHRCCGHVWLADAGGERTKTSQCLSSCGFHFLLDSITLGRIGSTVGVNARQGNVGTDRQGASDQCCANSIVKRLRKRCGDGISSTCQEKALITRSEFIGPGADAKIVGNVHGGLADLTTKTKRNACIARCVVGDRAAQSDL